MASARIHEVIAKEINKDYHMDEVLIRIGSVAPDSWRNVENNLIFKDKYLTHFWNYRIKDGQANDYSEFYSKYYNELSNPVYFGYLIHLMTDQYWKTYVDPKYEFKKNNKNMLKMKDGIFLVDKNNFAHAERVRLQKILARIYKLGYFPIEESEIKNFYCKIDELDLSGLFGQNGTLNYINSKLSPDDNYESQEFKLYDFNDIINSIYETIEFIKRELIRLEMLHNSLSMKYKIAIDIETLLLESLNNEKGIKLQKNIQECLDYLISNDYIVDLITSMSKNNFLKIKRNLVESLEENNLNYNYINFGFSSKLQFLKERGYNLLIDNDIKYIKSANSVGIDTILFNEYDKEYNGYQSSDWFNVKSLVNKIYINKNYFK